MSWWKFSLILTLAAALGAWGCGSSASSTVTIAISPTSASVITNRTQLFSGVVTGNSNTAITWSLACATGVAANSCGMIDATGLYTAPDKIPTTTSGTTVTIAPTVTITGTAKADTSKTAAATLTIVTGISISISNASATVGTGETFSFNATVNNPGCNLTSTPTCEDVTWSLSTTLTGVGTIISSPCNTQSNGQRECTGVYKAPTTVPTPSTVIITATSVADTSVTATGTATIVTAATPTVTAVSPSSTGLGGLFQDIYITGTNFISTNTVFINGAQLNPSFVTGVDTRTIRARIPDYILAVPPPSGILQVGVSEQTGTPQTCTPDASKCQVVVAGVRPGVVGPVPDSIAQGTAGVLSFMVNGGFFGTGSNPASPAVTATFNGQLRGIQLPASQSIGSTRQLSVTIGGGNNSTDFTVPGLYPVAIKSTTDSTKFAVTNLAVQPNYNNGSTITAIKDLTAADGIGASPSDVAINPATGMAVVANTGSNNVSLIDLTATSPTVVTSICTAALGAVPTGTPAACPSSGPTSVAVDYVRNIALVVNAATKTIAIVNLQTMKIQTVLPVLQDTPGAVGINPVTGHALVAMQQKNYGVLVDVNTDPILNPLGPRYFGIVSISTGSNTKVAVEPHLNWALATPGTLGSLGIVDLNQQSMNTIAAVSRTSGVVTVTVQSTGSAPPLSISAGDAVYVQNVALDPNQLPPGVPQSILAQSATFNGFYAVSSVGPGPNQFSYSQTNGTFTDVSSQSIPVPTSAGSINYAQPVATVGVPITTQGIGINQETQQAVLLDPTTGGSVSFFSLIDQSIVPMSLQVNNSPDVGTIAGAYNPLTNTVVAVNFFANTLSVIDPSGSPPRRLNDGNLLFRTRPGPIAVAVDPGTNIAVVANQTDNSVSVLNLGPIQPFSITATSPKTFVSASSLSSPPNPIPQKLTVIGKGFNCNGTSNPQVRLDGISLTTTCVGDREITAIVGTDKLTSARRYALDVADSSGNITNAEDFTVEQSIDVSSTLCPMPEPSGVAIDSQSNYALVTLFGCSSLALIDMTKGSGRSTTVGSNPIGVAVLPRLQTAVVANNGGGNASIVSYANGGLNATQTIATGSGAMGAAADDSTGEVAIANSLANTVTIVNASNGGTSNISTGQRPIAVGFNYVNHQIAVAASSGNSLGISGGTGGSVGQSFNVSAPTSVVYDPVTTDCGSNNNGATTNTVGCFIVNSSTGNSVNVIDPITNIQSGFRIGINPTAIAYNYFTSTLVSTNTLSHTVTVADFLRQRIRAVLPLIPATGANAALALNLANSGALQYALAIHPLTNIAVVADTANGTVLFLPLPR